MVRRVTVWVGLLFGLYLTAVLVLSNIYIGDHSILHLMIGNAVVPYQHGYTLQRFREAESRSDVDILFIGSSHSYQSFDPAVLARLGLKTFNIGSGSQAPLNTYYLLHQYYARLNPKLVVLEIYPPMLQLEGLEGFYDLAANREIAGDHLWMCLAMKSPQAINTLVARVMYDLTHSFDDVEQKVMPNQEYREGGYVFSKIIYTRDFFGAVRDVRVEEKQVNYLRKIINYVKQHNGDILLVTAPLPRKGVAAMTNYAEVSHLLESVAGEHGVNYYDFNRTMSLPTLEYFRDYHHLNGNGAKVFSYVLADSLLALAPTLKHLEIKPVNASDVVCGRAITAMSKGQIEQAISDLDLALSLDSGNARAYLNRGIALVSSQQAELAIGNFDRALTLSPNDPAVYYYRGIAYSSLGRYEKALTDFDRALALQPELAELYYNKAQALEAVGQTAAAVRAYEEFLKYASSQMQPVVDLVRTRIAELQ
ncbi:MAG: tetratricopeptide repeat protein [Candidatus Zixiibacteriota bacterium]|nr:MAG: tetratricopeptide repeat protein [candidate division Zixibacteria bacterium]